MGNSSIFSNIFLHAIGFSWEKCNPATLLWSQQWMNANFSYLVSGQDTKKNRDGGTGRQGGRGAGIYVGRIKSKTHSQPVLQQKSR